MSWHIFQDPNNFRGFNVGGQQLHTMIVFFVDLTLSLSLVWRPKLALINNPCLLAKLDYNLHCHNTNIYIYIIFQVQENRLPHLKERKKYEESLLQHYVAACYTIQDSVTKVLIVVYSIYYDCQICCTTIAPPILEKSYYIRVLRKVTLSLGPSFGPVIPVSSSICV